ncbi:DUF4347 domain-containing protein [Ferrimonas aestuarii]|uniref:DUF4347 domain-containing protein n=1 Tax=Ferrimonas aestuarii TaxID=2569539 RepID=A0A4U1BR48_9GAMM|nr:DUF4347 domain-containing protein [Ferrimonas aestuarii]TKB56628.1 DUF4347 domain-containing protein [Ferrimonas aestuarii]
MMDTRYTLAALLGAGISLFSQPSIAAPVSPDANRQITELVIVDGSLPQQQLFLDAISDNNTIKLHRLPSTENAIESLEQILSEYRQLHALHIVSHGDSGQLQLGNTIIDTASLTANPQLLQSIKRSIVPDGDLLLYGCNVAAGQQGKAFIEFVAEQANIDVAASTNLTGNALLGGDWTLERHSGQVEHLVRFSSNSMNAYSSVLGTEDLNNFTGVNTNTLTSPSGDFTVTGYVDGVQHNDLDIYGGNAYINDTTTVNKEGYFKIEANPGGSYPSFSLTDVWFQVYQNRPMNNVRVRGIDSDGNIIETVPTSTPTDDGGQDTFRFDEAGELSGADWRDLVSFEVYFTPYESNPGGGVDDNIATMEFKSFTVDTAAPSDVTAPTISGVTIPDSAHKVGDIVTATISVTSDGDNYASGGSISGTVNGYTLGSLSKTNDTTYTATFTVTDGGTNVAAASNVPVNFTLTDSSGNTSSAFTTAITQASDAIYANLPEVNLTTSSNSMSEDGGSATLTAALSSRSLNSQWPENITVNLAYTGTATASTDYTKSDSITITAGSSSNTATVTSSADDLYDAASDETIIVDISLPIGIEGATNQQTLTITDAESAPTVTLSGGNININENGGSGAITATLSHATYEGVVVNLSYSGSATYGSDYQNASSSITIAAGSLSGTAATGVASIDDASAETDETIIIDIASVSGGGATESGAQQRTITILDDEDNTPPTITGVSIPNLAHKVGDTVTATITVTSDSDDYTGGSGAISGTINGYNLIGLSRVDNTTYRATFTISDGGIDTDASNDIAVNVTLTDSSGNTSSAYTTAISQGSDAIYANLPEVELTTSSNSMSEDGGSATLTATLSGSLNSQWPVAITVGLAYTGTATADTDYTKADSIIVASGDSSNTATVTSTPDTLYDAAIDETIIVDISSLTVGTESTTNQQTITITDAETAPTVSLSTAKTSIDEDGGISDGSTKITATLSHATYEATTVSLAYSGTATSGSDYGTPSSSITINPGLLTADASTGLLATDDSDGEGNETIIIDISSVSGGGTTENGVQQVTVTLVDDEDSTPPTVVSASVSNITAAGAQLSVNLDEDGSVHYVVVADGANAPTVAQTKAGNNYSGVTVAASGSISTSATVATTTINTLLDGVNYDLYLVAEDSANNLQLLTSKRDFSTLDTLPNISSISVSGSPAADAASVVFDVTFADSVSGVSMDDFALTTVTGSSYEAPSISSVTGSGATWNVTVDTGVTVADIRLDLNAASNIVDESNNTPLGFTSGEMHSVNTNKLPTITEDSAVGPYAIDEDIKTNMDLSGLLISDANDEPLTLTMSVDRGLLFTTDGNGTVDGVTISGANVSGSTSLTLSGTPTALTQLFDGSRFSFQTDKDDDNNASLVFSVSDFFNEDDQLTATINVTAINDTPEIEGTPTTSLTSGNSYNFTPSASDVDGDTPLTFSITNKPSWANFDTSNGALTGQPSSANLGTTNNIVISVSDPGGLTAALPSFNITVNSANNAPVISGSPALTVSEDTLYQFVPEVIDADATDSHRFNISNLPSWASFDSATGTLSGTPTNDDVGMTAGIVISVSDSQGASDSLAPFDLEVLNVNDAPTITGSPLLSILVDEAYSFTPTATDIDANDTLSFSISNQPSWAQFDPNSGTLSGTPSKEDVGSSQTIVITVTDSANASASLLGFIIEVTSDNNAPIANDDLLTVEFNDEGLYALDVLANDSDPDGDTLTIESATTNLGSVTLSNDQLLYQAEDEYTGNVELSYVISDGNNGSASAQVMLTIERDTTNAPIIEVPEDVSVDATALFTRVELGTATAVDRNNNPLPVTQKEPTSRFAPGAHTVYWQAVDGDGNEAVEEQRVMVAPLISLSKDQTVFEGNEVQIEVVLNGMAPQYPVNVPYSISGSADDSDHDAIDGELVIQQGERGYIKFNTLADSINEIDETVVLTLSDSINRGAKYATTVTISEANIAPDFDYRVEQSGEERHTLSQQDGDVIVSMTAYDANPSDSVTVTWQHDQLVDLDSDEQVFRFDPSEMDAKTYELVATVTDNGSPAMSVTKSILFTIKANLAELADDQDSDGDLIPDSTEGYADDDGDGIPNYQDSANIVGCNVVQETLADQNQFLVEGEPGTCLRKGVISADSQQGGLQLQLEEITTVDNEAEIVGGIFDFVAYQLPKAGQIYNVVIPQRTPIPTGALYRKFINGEWSDFVVDANNQLLSTQGEEGYCPPPGDDVWQVGLQENAWCVQLSIQDGGPNDDDGLANGTIVDPGGVAVPLNTNTAPVAVDDLMSIDTNESITIMVLDNDIDADGDALTITSAQAEIGTANVTDQISIHYTPQPDYIGKDTVTYTVTDGNGGTASAKIYIEINAVEDEIISNKSTGSGSLSWLFLGLLLLSVYRQRNATC